MDMHDKISVPAITDADATVGTARSGCLCPSHIVGVGGVGMLLKDQRAKVAGGVSSRSAVMPQWHMQNVAQLCSDHVYITTCR
jgi:hypothetical protein